MALHMLFQMGRLLESLATLFTFMDDLLARRTTILVILQAIHLILHRTRVSSSEPPQKKHAFCETKEWCRDDHHYTHYLMMVQHMGADQALLGPNNTAELTLVSPYIPHRSRRRRRHPGHGLPAAHRQ
jgi:hypothetical protein